MKYFSTGSLILEGLNEKVITDKYNKGYIFTRVKKGHMNQTRSLRINLLDFGLNSENRRILRKTEDLVLEVKKIPLKNYSWEVHKMGKEFYSKKFGDFTISASKIKEMFTDPKKSNMNSSFICRNYQNQNIVGYCLAYINETLVHYAYPFYDLSFPNKNIGMGMMVMAIKYAKENNKKFIYLGSVTTPESKYKLQFKGLEWYDETREGWSSDITSLVNILDNLAHKKNPR